MTTEARMNEPSPIRGRWTMPVSACRVCDAKRHWTEIPDEPCGHDPETHRRTIEVEVVPVPDEQAIERAAKALPMFHPDDAREIVRAVLAAALEQPE
jgi:hypothetical protein